MEMNIRDSDIFNNFVMLGADSHVANFSILDDIALMLLVLPVAGRLLLVCKLLMAKLDEA